MSSASVSTGGVVCIAGKRFLPGEPISINVKYRITRHSGGFDGPFPARVSGDRRTDDDGKFEANVRLTSPGYATIKVTGKKSKQTATVTVRVLAWRGNYSFGGDDFFAGTPLGNGVRNNGGGDKWDGGDRPAGFFGPFFGGWSPFRLSANETSLTDASDASDASAASTSSSTDLAGGTTKTHDAQGADLLAGLLGLTALAGSGFVMRRRRTS
ncbi:hypothetical protein [Dactylosporangium sp. NPDC000521]|uniref:hypothetical protein n=1 Tax=Dactylosporangium sp. NPDC000521 TaxID=3363975 RepID=UPI0036A90B9D